MRRGRKKKYYLLSIKQYLTLLFLSFRNPYKFSQNINKDAYYKNALLFYFISLSIGLVLKAIIDVIYYQKIVIIFLHLTEIIIILPLSIVGVLFLTFALHTFAKILRGNAKFISSFRAILYASSPLIFYSIPIINVLSLTWVIVLLIFNFRMSHEYSKLKAALNILIPFLIIVLIGSLLGLYTFNLFEIIKFF